MKLLLPVAVEEEVQGEPVVCSVEPLVGVEEQLRYYVVHPALKMVDVLPLVDLPTVVEDYLMFPVEAMV
jgi:hypothetical protein